MKYLANENVDIQIKQSSNAVSLFHISWELAAAFSLILPAIALS